MRKNYLYPFGHFGLIPVTFFVNFPFRQLIVFCFETTFFATAFVAEGVGDGVAKTVLGVALGVGVVVKDAIGVGAIVAVAVAEGVGKGVSGDVGADAPDPLDPPAGAGEVGAAVAKPRRKVRPVDICVVEFPAWSRKGLINNSQVPFAKVLGIDIRQRYEPYIESPL